MVPLLWNPNLLTVTLTRSESAARTVEASITVPRNIYPLGEATFKAEVSPELAPFVSIAPQTFTTHGRPDETVTQVLTLTFTIPSEEAYRTMQGELRLVPVSDGRVVIPEAGSIVAAPVVPVSLNIGPRVAIASSALTLAHPDNLTVAELERFSGTQEITFQDVFDLGFSVLVVDTPSDPSTVFEWAETQTWPFSLDWRDYFLLTTVAGVDALQDRETRSVILKRGEQLIYLTNGLGREDDDILDRDQFDSIVASAQFAP